jgi:hypothetical protein
MSWSVAIESGKVGRGLDDLLFLGCGQTAAVVVDVVDSFGSVETIIDSLGEYKDVTCEIFVIAAASKLPKGVIFELYSPLFCSLSCPRYVLVTTLAACKRRC